MPSSESRFKCARVVACGGFRLLRAALAAVAVVSASLCVNVARAQQQAQGFAVERFYPAAPGGGWMVMDDLDMGGRLGGVVALSGGYAYKPLHPSQGSESLDLVKHEAFADVGAAVTFERYRLYLNLTSPLAIKGNSGVVGNYRFAAPAVTISEIPDLVSDARIGFDARLIGDADSRLRWGLGAQLIVPNGNRSDYDTDGHLRAMIRSLFAGTLGPFNMAGQLGVHVRSLNDSPVPDSPRGSELLVGLAVGPRFAVTSDKSIQAVVGPEVFGATAFDAFLGNSSSALEGLITGRLEGTRRDGMQLRLKLSTGRGLHQRFGAPEWRALFGLEMFDRND